MARTKAYNKSVEMQIRNINRRLLNLERLLGMDSEQYRRYINSITAALPSDTFKLDAATGRVRIKTSKQAVGKIKLGQLRSTLKNPTAAESIKRAKASIKKVRQARVQAVAGSDEGEPGELAAIDKITVSDMEALEELRAKQKLQDYQDETGELKYDESVKADMLQKGRKTYTELVAILDKGKRNAEARAAAEAAAEKENEKKEKRRAANREYYQKNKERINERRRATRNAKRNGMG